MTYSFTWKKSRGKAQSMRHCKHLSQASLLIFELRKDNAIISIYNIWSLNYNTTVTNTNELEVSELEVCRILFYYYLEDIATDRGLFSKILALQQRDKAAVAVAGYD